MNVGHELYIESIDLIDNNTSDDLLRECQLISKEMAFDLVFKGIQSLERTEKDVIRYSFGLPKDTQGVKSYPQLDRKEIAEALELHPREVLNIRKQALKKLFQYIFNED